MNKIQVKTYIHKQIINQLNIQFIYFKQFQQGHQVHQQINTSKKIKPKIWLQILKQINIRQKIQSKRNYITHQLSPTSQKRIRINQ
ncbi:hypothetical protein TTHERM_000086849 (macronuclear) [Tetrahymena thermophila SB210]|uniref:Uncharacterized protein n=1 Tax=Tetrahymena thermophila (strain SB210) TaxID=312017 RepID=W7X753_TETTS|nr:hypothetical protein TTHERM_000086849 [Tetrahymena thermophila SB210]EWS75220.1 hypothetical protein TTHERM_000086849 [Tetrahymena thermophila SB210]|eukprot:XP_012652211.1 hypothetical protein TTHERM_000086849 [Tetrahymena thermophila SB210]